MMALITSNCGLKSQVGTAAAMAVTLSGEVYAWEPGGGEPRPLPL